MLKRLPLLRRVASLILVAAVAIVAGFAQAPHPLTDADRQRIDEIIHKMTLAEKLGLYRRHEMTIRAVPSAGVRALQMSDGQSAFGWTPALPRPLRGRYCSRASWDPNCAARGRWYWTCCAGARDQLHAWPGGEYLSPRRATAAL